MKVDFYVPCSVRGYRERTRKWVSYHGTVSTLVDEIERQLQCDFSDDIAEYGMSDDAKTLGYTVYSGGVNMTVYKGKLYIRVTVFFKFPQYDEKLPFNDGTTITAPRANIKDFKKFLDMCIHEINGQMSDGWGEGFEQRDFRLSYDKEVRFYATPGSVEFAIWDGVAVDNRGKMMRPVIYNSGSKLFDHGWVGGPRMDLGLEFLICTIRGRSVVYHAITKHQGVMTKRDYKKEKKITKDLMSRYEVDSIFIDRFIDWYIRTRKKDSILGLKKDEEKKLRAYRELFKGG